MRKVLALFIVGLFSGNAGYAAALDSTGIISVKIASGKQLGTGFVADGMGHIIAHIKASSRPLLVNTTDGTEYTADMVARDKISGLSLLKVTGDIAVLNPYIVARDPAEPQRKVFGIKVHADPAQNEVVGGALADIRQPENNALTGYYLHNARVDEAGMGGPLFNNCGEVVGVIVPKPKSFAGLFISDEERTSYAVPIEWLISRFVQGLHLQRATTPCLSDADQAAAAQARLEEESRRAAEAVQETATAQARLEEESLRATEAVQETAAAQARLEEESRRAAEAAQETAAAQAELDAIKNQLEQAQGAGEEERQRLEAEIAARQTAVDEAHNRKAAADRALETARQALETLEAAHRASEERTEQYKRWGMLGGGALLLLLLLVWAVKQRAVTRERREKTAARSLAEEAQAGLADRKREEERIRRTPAVFFEGVDAAGQTVALRIPGASIAASTGAIVGRNPSDSDFVINHPEVSRRQFRLFTDEDLLMIADLGSTNSTRVDGKTLAAGQKNALANESRVELGDLKLSVRLEKIE